jgi:hypothetical protein
MVHCKRINSYLLCNLLGYCFGWSIKEALIERRLKRRFLLHGDTPSWFIQGMDEIRSALSKLVIRLRAI